jgi:molybdopterin molybdotransferase
MGKYDLVAQALAKVGVQELFHRVAVKPGKPLWFGTRETRLVFALPGNPVSCLVNHTLFVGPALRRMGGEQPAETPALFGRWEGKAVAANAREQYLPVTLHSSETAIACLRPVLFSGSADVVGVTRAQALAVVGADRGLAPGEVARYLPLT